MESAFFSVALPTAALGGFASVIIAALSLILSKRAFQKDTLNKMLGFSAKLDELGAEQDELIAKRQIELDYLKQLKTEDLPADFDERIDCLKALIILGIEQGEQHVRFVYEYRDFLRSAIKKIPELNIAQAEGRAKSMEEAVDRSRAGSKEILDLLSNVQKNLKNRQDMAGN